MHCYTKLPVFCHLEKVFYYYNNSFHIAMLAIPPEVAPKKAAFIFTEVSRNALFNND